MADLPVRNASSITISDTPEGGSLIGMKAGAMIQARIGGARGLIVSDALGRVPDAALPAGLNGIADRVDTLESSQSAGFPGYQTAALLPGTPPVGVNLALVTNDPNPALNGTYRWSGSAWVQADDRFTTFETRVAEAEQLTAGVKMVAAGVNLFTPVGATAGRSVSAADGTLFVKANWSATDFIPVLPETAYRRTSNDAYAQYDSGGNFIAGAANATTFATARNTAFVRLGYANANVGTEVLAKASEWPAGYVAFQGSPAVPKVTLQASDVKRAITGPCGLRDDLKVSPYNASFLVHASPNLFDKTRITPGVRLSLTEIPVYDTTNNVSDFIPVKPSTAYRVSEGSFTHQYDANFNLIHSHGTGLTTFTTQAGAAWLRTTVRNVRLNDLMLVEGPTLPGTYVPFNRYTFGPEIVAAGQTSRLTGCKWNALGDSITAAAGSYVDAVSLALGATVTRNYGIGGTAIAVRAAPWDTNAMCIRYVDMDADASLITVAGGTNDFGTSVLMGTMASTATNTFYGALHTLCAGLIDRYPAASIVFFTPLPRYNMQTLNGRSLLLKDYVNAMKEVCEYYAIPVVDLFRMTQFRPWDADNATALMPDGLHPNAAGYSMMSAIAAHALKGL